MEERTLYVVLSFLVSLGVAYAVIPRIIIVSYRKRLFDPPEERKTHHAAVPRLGGVSFFPAILFSISFVLGLYFLREDRLPDLIDTVPRLLFAMCTALLLYLVGILDDLIGARWRVKLAVQTVCAVMMVLSGAWIDNLYGLFNIHAIPPVVGMPLTVLIVVSIINAINLIDGIDGLASGLVGIVLSVTGVMFFLNGQLMAVLIAFATLGAVVAFLRFNVFSRHKIFMGDTGSLTLGMIVSLLVVRLCMSSCGVGATLTVNPVLTAISLLMVPLLDVVNVVVLRLRHNASIFVPDRNHIHHRFLEMGFTSRQSMLMIVGLSAFYIAVNLLLAPVMDDTLLLCLDMVSWILVQTAIGRRIRAVRLKAGAENKSGVVNLNEMNLHE